MKNCSFKVGVNLLIDGERLRIVRILADGRVQLEAENDGSLSATTFDDLLEKYSQMKLSFTDDVNLVTDDSLLTFSRALSTFTEPVQVKAVRKKRYLDLLLELGPFISTPGILNPLIKTCAEKLNDKNPPGAITVYRWYRRLVASQRDHRALIDRHYLKGGRRSRFCPKILAIIQDTIDDIYLTQQRNSGEEVVGEVRHRIAKANQLLLPEEKLVVPSRSTIYRAIRQLDKHDEMAARYGKHIAAMKFRTSGLGVRPKRILERVEIDHTPLDLFIIDEQTGLPHGRPTVTIAIDAYSKMPVGMHIGFQGSSIEAVFACLRHALVPKTYIKAAYPEIENDWPCYGYIENLVCDNGLEFHSHELERLAFELGIQIQFCPKRQAYYKGSVERHLKTLNFQFSRTMPGQSFAKWFQREDYDPLEHAVLTFDQLMLHVHRWIIDVYMQKLHRGINTSPYHRWMEGAKISPPKLVSDLNRLDIALGRTCERTLFHYGVELHNLRYNDTSLLILRRQHGEALKVEVRYYAHDVSYVHVINPDTKEAILVPALDQQYAKGLSMEQHRLICARVREINAGIINLDALAQAKAEIRQIVKELSLSKLQRNRTRAAKIKGIGQRKPKPDVTDIPAAAHNEPPLPPPSKFSREINLDELPDIGTLKLPRPPKKNNGNKL